MSEFFLLNVEIDFKFAAGRTRPLFDEFIIAAVGLNLPFDAYILYARSTDETIGFYLDLFYPLSLSLLFLAPVDDVRFIY